MLLDLTFAHAGSPSLSRRTSLSFLALKRLKRPPRILDTLLRSTQLLCSHKHARPTWRRTAGHRPARLVHVPIERDTPDSDVASERDGLRSSRVVADQRVVEHESDRFGHLIWVTDE